MSLKQRAYPDCGQQIETLTMHLNHARFVYNTGLDQRKMSTRSDRERNGTVTAALQQRQLTEARKSFDWLREGSTVIQQGALRDLDRAFVNFFAGRAKFPTHRRRNDRQSFVVRDVSLRRYNRKWAAVLVPKCGWVRFRLSYNWAEVESATSARVIFQNNRWHVTFTTPPRKKRKSGSGVVGIDRGITVTAMTSEGENHSVPSLTLAEQHRFLYLQQLLATQSKGSNRRSVTLSKLSELRNRLGDRRTEWIEKTTTHLAEKYDAVVLEDLKVSNMTRKPAPIPDDDGGYLPNGSAAKRALNRAINGSVWGRFAARLSDKTTVITVNPAFTSQRCHTCGHTSADNRDSQAVFRCVKCGHEDNADHNAAKNIKADGLALLCQQPGDTGCSDEPVDGNVNLQLAT